MRTSGHLLQDQPPLGVHFARRAFLLLELDVLPREHAPVLDERGGDLARVPEAQLAAADERTAGDVEHQVVRADAARASARVAIAVRIEEQPAAGLEHARELAERAPRGA